MSKEWGYYVRQTNRQKKKQKYENEKDYLFLERCHEKCKIIYNVN